MKKVFDFNIPVLPPSVNSIYRYGRSGVYKKESVDVFEKTAGYYLQRQKDPITKPCRLELLFTFADSKKFKASDVDNLLKVTIDMLQHFKYVKNDNLIFEIEAKKNTGAHESVSGTLFLL